MKNIQECNIFIEPEKYIEEIIRKVRMPEEKRRVFEGKSLASIFPTKFCDAGCAHCFFKSDKDNMTMYPRERCEFSDYGIKKFIEFINKSNNGYLLVIGGGEPFKKYKNILEIIEKVKTDRLILVTNGIWGKDYREAKKVIFELYEMFKKRTTNKLFFWINTIFIRFALNIPLNKIINSSYMAKLLWAVSKFFN